MSDPLYDLNDAISAWAFNHVAEVTDEQLDQAVHAVQAIFAPPAEPDPDDDRTYRILVKSDEYRVAIVTAPNAEAARQMIVDGNFESEFSGCENTTIVDFEDIT